MTLLDFQLVLGRRNIRSPHFASKVSYSASPQASAKCPRGSPCSYVVSAMLFGSKPRRDFLDFAPQPFNTLLISAAYSNNYSATH